MKALVEHARSESLSDDDIAYLASSCAEASGPIWTALDGAVDVASTGGPTSLTTLICPLYLRSFGSSVPKLGVPGRPAGGIDVLAQIPGFKYTLTDSEAIGVLKRAGYVHFLAGDSHGRHDAILFSYRKSHNELASAPLVIASLLTKKLVVGLTRVGLDVRVSSFGNFGQTWNEAKINAQRFCKVAALLGISARCFLTDGSVPYQPYIGRGESLVALAKSFEKISAPELSDHLNLCYAIAHSTSESERMRPPAERLMAAFEENVLAQGGSVDGFFDKADQISRAHRFVLTANSEGFLHVNIEKIRKTLVAAQDLVASPENAFPDPVGIILKARSDAYVVKGEIIATVRSNENSWSQLQKELNDGITVCRTPVRSEFFEEVSSV